MYWIIRAAPFGRVVKRLHPEGIKNRQARLAGNGPSLPRGATPRTTASRLAEPINITLAEY